MIKEVDSRSAAGCYDRKRTTKLTLFSSLLSWRKAPVKQAFDRDVKRNDVVLIRVQRAWTLS